MRTAPVPVPAGPRPLRASRRLLKLAGDERLVEQIRRGNEAAFEVVFERHGPAILSYCRHMLGSREEAEDAVQHAFSAAYRDLLRDERPIKLKPWLFTIARNRCLSMLRSRREQSLEHREPATAGLAEQVEHRSELRELLEDLGDLPEEQRAALLLAELGDLSHAEVAQVLGCEVHKVKALVFRARSGLIERREARDEPCEAIREQLANLRGGALRRRELRHHLRACAGCREYREQVRRQRGMLAAALPVAPSVGLKSAVLGSVGFGGGSIGGGSLLGGLGAAVAGPVSGATLAKVAVVGALVGGGAVGGDQVLNRADPAKPGEPAAAETPAPPKAAEGAIGDVPAGGRAPQENGRPGKARRGKARERSQRGRAARHGGRARGHEKRAAGEKAEKGTGNARARQPAGNGRSDAPRRAEGPARKPAPPPAPQVKPPRVKSPASSPRAPQAGERAKPFRKQREPAGESTLPAG